MVRVLPDTNVLVSGLLFDGNECEVLRRGLRGEWQLVFPEDVLVEARRVLREKFRDHPSGVAAKALIVHIPLISRAIPRDGYLQWLEEAASLIRDRSDAPILAAALAADVDVLVTGDPDFDALTGPVPFDVESARSFLEGR